MLPSEFPEVKRYHWLKRLLRDQVDMQFEDLRMMLCLPRGTLKAECNFAAAAVLFNLISGSSVCFFNASLKDFKEQSKRGPRFKDLLDKYYPWRREPVGGERVINTLWEYARNPLAHTLGFHDPGKGPGVGLRKWPLTPRKVREIEEAVERPDWLCLPTVSGWKRTSNADTLLVISVPTLYWGTHRMLHKLFAEPSQAKKADALARELMDGA